MSLREAEVLLPEKIQEIVSIIGFSQTEILVRERGGVTYKLPTRDDRVSAVVADLLEPLTENARQNLLRHFAGESLYIARCDEALRYLRNQQFYEDFDEMTDEGSSKSEAIRRLCPRYGITDRYAWMLLKLREQWQNPQQNPLF